MLAPDLRRAINGAPGGAADVGVATAKSFGFEWAAFPEMYAEWEAAFQGYMQPHGPDFFRGKRVLDAGCGGGRFAYHAARYGADVWAVDLGPSVEVARRNTAPTGRVHVVQADLNRLPFAEESFDLVYSLGVLHHLRDPQAGFRNLLRYVKPGGELRVYLYWAPERQPVKKTLLKAVGALRLVTTRLPHPLLYLLAYPAAWAAYGFFVLPYRVLRRIPGLAKLAERLPMKQYANYPFRVCVNDQFDRFSAPIENRYRRADVERWFRDAGLEEVRVLPNYGWVGFGRKPGPKGAAEFPHEPTAASRHSLNQEPCPL
jgi:SAM-dependent methyltransferase